MIVEDLQRRTDGATTELSAVVRGARIEPVRLWFRVTAEDVATDASPFVAAALAPCMRWREPLRIEAPVSKRLLDSLPEIQSIYARQWRERGGAWAVRLDPVDVSAEPGTSDRSESGARAQFFTRGVDSWFTLLEARPRPSHLVFVPSFDTWLSPAHRQETVRLISDAAASVGLPLVVIETNVRMLTDRCATWDQLHPLGLVASALALGVPDVTFAALFARGSLLPWGYDRLADLWSTERTQLTQHGADVRRIDKIERVSSEPLALESLKVCLQADTARNCGRCGKCLRTMAALHALGALDQCPTFEASLDPGRLATTRFFQAGQRLHAEEVIQRLGSSPFDVELRRALEESLRGGTLFRRGVNAVRSSIANVDKRFLDGRLRAVVKR